MKLREWVVLLLLAAIWGGSHLFMRMAAPSLGAILLIELRVLIAAVVLLAVNAAAGMGRRSVPPTAWVPLAVVGVLNSAVPFTLFAEALRHVPVALAAPLNATTPLFGALAAAVGLGERFTAGRAVGLTLGLAGVVLVVGGGTLPVDGVVVRAAGLCLLGSACYGTAAVYARRRLGDVQPRQTAAYSQVFAAAALAPLVPAAWPKAAPSMTVVGAVLALGALCTGLAYLLYFHLIAHAGAVQATTVTYLAPAFGVIWGVLLLHETLTPVTLLGFALIAAGAALLSAPQGRSSVPAGHIPRPVGMVPGRDVR